MSATRCRALRPVPRMLGVGLTAAAAVFAAVTGWSTGHGGLQIVSVVLVCATALRAFEKGARGEESVEKAAPKTESPSRTDAPRGPWGHRLGEGLRMSLQVLGHVGQELTGLDRRQLADAAEVVKEESERLVGVVDEMVGPGAGKPEGRIEMEGLLEELLSAHRPLLQTLDAKVRVMMGHRRAEVSGDRGALLEAFGALLRHTLSQLETGAEVHVRTREVAGLFSVQLYGEANMDGPVPEPLEVEQACQILAFHGGEVWEDEDAGCGFGLTLPLDRPRRTSARRLQAAVA